MKKLNLEHCKAIAYALGVTDATFAKNPPADWQKYQPKIVEALEILRDMICSFELSNPDEEPYVDPSHVN